MKMNLKSIFYKFDLNLKEDNFNEIIYEEAKECKENLKPFF